MISHRQEWISRASGIVVTGQQYIIPLNLHEISIYALPSGGRVSMQAKVTYPSVEFAQVAGRQLSEPYGTINFLGGFPEQVESFP